MPKSAVSSTYIRKENLVVPPALIRWLDVAQAAALLSVSTSTIRRFLHSGELRASTIGGNYRIDRNDLDELMLRKKGVVRPLAIGTRPDIAQLHQRNRARKATRGAR